MKSRMKSSMKIGLIVTLAALLGVGAVAMATDFVWDGAGVGQGGGTEAWLNETMWDVGSGYPDNANDNATLDDPGTTANCEYSPTSALTINDLVIAGDSPTKMKLIVKDNTLAVSSLDLGDYAEMDVDANFTASAAEMSGDVWMDVADSTTADLGAADVVGSSIAASPITCVLHWEDNSSGAVTMATLDIDAEAGDAGRGLKLSGATGAAVTVTDTLTVKCKQSSGTKKAKLWVSSGSLSIDDGDTGTATLVIDGGDDSSRSAELDIDDTLTAEQTNVLSGYAIIDVASGTFAYLAEYTLNGGAIVTVTGSGTVKSGSAP